MLTLTASRPMAKSASNPTELISLRDGVAVLAIRGDLDIVHTPRLQVAVNEALRAQPVALVIDVREVTFVDSTGLALLLNAQRRASHQGLALELACAEERMLQLLSLTRLDREFQIHASRREAVRAARAAARRGSS